MKVLNPEFNLESFLQYEALLINPYDVEGVAETIFKGLMLPPGECKKRMRKMRRNVQHYDVFWWVRSFLQSAISKNLEDFPVIEEFTTSEIADDE
ncbi:MAG: trehalose-6-phosphate synthase [Parachlamydiales bacterium]|jgi:trehalose 6-phosphate synthase